jgi:aspartate/methionine/tyrosine aminotransferase
MKAIPFSGIRGVFEEVARRQKMGEKIIPLNIGEPDFDTPDTSRGSQESTGYERFTIHPTTDPDLREALPRS